MGTVPVLLTSALVQDAQNVEEEIKNVQVEGYSGGDVLFGGELLHYHLRIEH